MAIDIMTAFTAEPPELDFIWPGFLSGTVGALVAPGATGKSFWALEASMSIACSVAGGDLLDIQPKYTGRVIYFAGEDPATALIRRVHAIGQHLNESSREVIAENLIIEPVLGKRLDITKNEHLCRLIEFCRDVRLIIFDTLSRIHTLDENNNGDMAQIISTLEYLSSETGASVLFLHHVSKNSSRDKQNDQQHAARGASSLIDNARWCGFIAKMTEEEAKKLSDRKYDKQPIGDRRGFFCRMGVSKQNYDITASDRWYQRHAGGVLLPVEMYQAQNEKQGQGRRGRA